MFRLQSATLLVSVLWTLSGPVRAQDDEVLFNRVYLDVQVQRDVPNDEMEVIFVTEHQGPAPAAIADLVNADMSWALAELKRYKDVKSATRGYQTFPVYDKRVISGWRASQELRLTSLAIPRLTEVVGKLQERLQVRGMNFRPTPATIDQYQDELISEAVSAFKQRVEVVRKQMDNREYRIIEMHINSGGMQPPMPYAERAAMATMKMDVAPAVEAGTSTVTVNVSGSVQFY